jgi:hypothetical protein
MHESDLHRLQRASDELRRGGLRFCTRCGAEVDPYQPSESLGHDEYWDYDQPLAADAGLRQHGDSAYWCPVCQARWYAVGWQDTGSVHACGHFMPAYVTYCAACGQRVR